MIINHWLLLLTLIITVFIKLISNSRQINILDFVWIATKSVNWELLAPKYLRNGRKKAVQQFGVKIPINSDNFPIHVFPVLSPLVSTDPTVPTDPLHPQPYPTVPPLNLTSPSAEAPASDVLPTPTPVSAALLPPQSSVEQAQTPSSLQHFTITFLLYPTHQFRLSTPYAFLLPSDVLLLLHALMSPPTQQPVHRYPPTSLSLMPMQQHESTVVNSPPQTRCLLPPLRSRPFQLSTRRSSPCPQRSV